MGIKPVFSQEQEEETANHLLILSKLGWSDRFVASSTSQLILQPFRRFTYVTSHSKTLPFLHLRPLASRP